MWLFTGRSNKSVERIPCLGIIFGLLIVTPAWAQTKGYPGNDLVVPPPPPRSITTEQQGDQQAEQPASSPSSILFEYGQSTGRNEDIYTELDFGVGPNGGLVRLGYGTNEVDTDRKGLLTETYYLAVSGFISNDMGLGFSYRSWGDSGDLMTRAFTGTASWYSQDSIYSLTGIVRNIELFTASPDPDNDRVTGTGNGIEGGFVHRFSPRLEFIADALFYDYSLNMREFATYSSGILTNRALELGSSFLDSNYRLEVGYYFPMSRISGQWENSVSAVDGTDSNTLLLRCDLFARSGYQVYVLGGHTLTSNDLTSNFGRVGLVYLW